MTVWVVELLTQFLEEMFEKELLKFVETWNLGNYGTACYIHLYELIAHLQEVKITLIDPMNP